MEKTDLYEAFFQESSNYYIGQLNYSLFSSYSCLPLSYIQNNDNPLA